jgi:hypothetical protein
MAIDLSLKEDLAAIAAYRAQLAAMETAVADWSGELVTNRSKALAAWEGHAATLFGGVTAGTRVWLDALVSIIHRLEQAVQTFYDSVKSVRGKLDDIADRARLTEGLEVIGQSIQPAYGSTSPDYQKVVLAYNEFAIERDQVMSLLYEAQLAFQRVCDAVVQPAGMVIDGDADPASVQDAVGKAQEVLSAAGEHLAPASAAFLLAHWGRYAPRGINGRFLAFNEQTLAEYSKKNLENWVPKPGNAGKWAAVDKFSGRVPPVLKGLSVVGWGLVALDAYGDAAAQWERDSHDPTLGSAEKTARAGAAALGNNAAEVAGGLVGTAVGAWAGAKVGTAIFPEGGGAVGGFIGALGGSLFGTEEGKRVRDATSGWVDSTVDGIRW